MQIINVARLKELMAAQPKPEDPGKQGWSINDFAKAAGLKRYEAVNILYGLSKSPKYHIAKKIAECFKVEIDSIYTEEMDVAET